MLYNKKIACLVAVALLMLGSFSPSRPAVASDSSQAPLSTPSWPDILRKRVRYQTTSLAAQLDSFFGDRRYESQQNETRLSLSFVLDGRGNDGVNLKVVPSLRLRLPNLEQAVFIDFFGTQTLQSETGTSTPSDRLDEFLGREDRRILQVRAISEFAGLRVTPRLGLEQIDGEIGLFAGVEASLSGEPAPGFSYLAIQNLLLTSDHGTEANTFLRADQQIGAASLLRGQFQITWDDGVPGVDINSGLIFRHALSEKAVLSFEGYANTLTRSQYAYQSVLVGVRYRRLVYGDWLFAEIAPWMSRDHANGEQNDYRVRFIIESNF